MVSFEIQNMILNLFENSKVLDSRQISDKTGMRIEKVRLVLEMLVIENKLEVHNINKVKKGYARRIGNVNSGNLQAESIQEMYVPIDNQGLFVSDVQSAKANTELGGEIIKDGLPSLADRVQQLLDYAQSKGAPIANYSKKKD